MSNSTTQTVEKDIGTTIMDIIVMLLEDQNGKSYEYRRIDSSKEETA